MPANTLPLDLTSRSGFIIGCWFFNSPLEVVNYLNALGFNDFQCLSNLIKPWLRGKEFKSFKYYSKQLCLSSRKHVTFQITLF